MPSLLIKTNAEASETEKLAVMSACSMAVSEVTGKPESFVLVSFEHATMMFGGSTRPCAYAYLASLGALGPSVNPTIVKKISEILEIKLDIPVDRTYIQFCDVKERSDFGWNGTTFG